MVHLLDKNKNEFLLTVAIIAMDLGVLICLFISGAGPLKKVNGVKILKYYNNKNYYNQNVKDFCEKINNTKVRAYSQKDTYILCFISGIFYIFALILGITKIVMPIEISSIKGLEWIITVAARFVIFVLAITGATCNWDFWERIKKCFGGCDSKYEPCKTYKKLKSCFIVVLIFASIGLVLEVVVSLFFRKEQGTTSAEVQSDVQPVVKKEDKVYA